MAIEGFPTRLGLSVKSLPIGQTIAGMPEHRVRAGCEGGGDV
jgi:hypothetical protein